jgi:hypothetical protein
MLANSVVTVGDLLQRLGTMPGEIPLAVPYMFMAPAASDPDMPAIHIVIKAVQRGLNKLGAGLRVDGYLGVDTARALDVVSPPAGSYVGKTWLRLVHDTFKAIGMGKVIQATGRVRAPVPMALAMGAEEDKATFGFIPLVVLGGLAAVLIGMASRSGRSE